MIKITVSSKKHKEVLDITDEVNEEIARQKVESGICNLFLMHTSCALTVADLDPGTDEDYLDAYAAMVPKLNYRHPHDPSHMGDHIMSAAIGVCVTVPFEEKALILGTWQRVILVELNGPRTRSIIVNCQ